MADQEKLTQLVLDLYLGAATALESIPPYKRKKYDEIEAIFVDVVNGKLKGYSTASFQDILEAATEGSKPIGLILHDWDNPEKMIVKEFAGLSEEESHIVMAQFAEAQDQAKEGFYGSEAND